MQSSCRLPFNCGLKKRRLPFVGLTLAAIVGILLEEIFQWPSWTLILGIIVAFGGWCFLRRWRLSFCFLLVALFFGSIHAWQWQESPARQLASLINNSNSTVLVKGVVASEVKQTGKNQVAFFIEVEQLEWNSVALICNRLPSKLVTGDEEQGMVAHRRGYQGMFNEASAVMAQLFASIIEFGKRSYVAMFVHWEGAMPHCGDLVSLRATAVSTPMSKNPGEFNKVAWLARQQVNTELRMDPSEPGMIVSSRYGSLLKRSAIQWRDRAEKLLEVGIENDSAVVNVIKGIVLGIKENETLFEDFKLTGTMHLFAVSGLHVGMVVMIILFFLKLLQCSSRVAVPVTLLLLFFYIMITGFHVGSLRAGVMVAVVLMGFLLERRPQVLNSLVAAAFLLLLFNTNFLFSMGWQFSFSVVLAIVLLTSSLGKYFEKYFEFDPFLPKSLITPWQQRWQHVVKHVAQLVAVSAAAWIGALLPTAYYFHQISFSALGANLMAVPLTFLIMVTALLAIGVGVILPSGAMIFNNANWLFVKMLLGVVHGFALLPLSSYTVALSTPPVRLTIFDIPHAQAIVLQSEGKTWVINAARAFQASKTLIPFLETSGISKIEGLVLTQCDAGSVGGASLLLGKWKPHLITAPSDPGRAIQFRQFEKAYHAIHQEIMPLPKNLDFSKKCEGEFFAPSNIPPFAFKLHWNEGNFFVIPHPALAEWILKQASSSSFSADVLYLAWRPMDLLRYEPLFIKMKPKILILPEMFPSHGFLRQEEQKMLERYGIKLFDQEQTGAVVIDVLNDRTLRVKGWKENQAVTSFQCK